MKAFFYQISLPFFLLFLASCNATEDKNDKILPKPNELNLSTEKRIAYLTKLINEEDFAKVRYERAKLYLQIDRIPAALRDINRAIAFSKEPQYFVIKAQAEFLEGNEIVALADALYAFRNDIKSSDLYLLLGKLYYSQKKYSEAIEFAQKALLILPNSFDTNYLNGKVYEAQNDTASAFKYLANAISISPKTKEAYHTMMSLMNRNELYSNAADIAKRYLQHNEPDAAFSFYLGEAIENTTSLDSAIFWFEKSYTLQNHWRPGIKLARYRMNKGDFREASRLYENILPQNPSIENGYYELGYLHEYLLGSLDKALEAYQRGLEADTLNKRYSYYIARVNRKLSTNLQLPNSENAIE